MKPGEVVRHRKQTTYCVGNAHYILVRRTWFGAAEVVETEAFHGLHVLHACDTRAEAELIAQAYVATRMYRPATPDRAEA